MQPLRGHASLPMPFATTSDTGDRVPVFSVNRGAVTKRDWTFTHEIWCSICLEPVSTWLTHIGRKDHALQDAHYDSIVDLPGRRWDPRAVLLGATRSAQRPASEGGDELRALSNFGDGAPELQSYQRVVDSDEYRRRWEMAAMIQFLADRGVLCLDRDQADAHQHKHHWFGSNTDAHMLLHSHMIPELLRLQPLCDLPLLSNYEDFVSSSYNFETVYDLCGFAALDPDGRIANQEAADELAASAPSSQPQQQPMDGLRRLSAVGDRAANFSATTVESAGAALEPTAGEEVDDVSVSHKAHFIKNIMRQLRWMVMETEPPNELMAEVPEALVAIGQLLVRALLAELVHARVCEYMVRAEVPWRRYGMERRVLAGDSAVDEPRRLRSRYDAVPEPHSRPCWPLPRGSGGFYSVSDEGQPPQGG